MLKPVIMCGGSGTRLWPLSRRSRPKQMLALTGDLTLLQLTGLRVRDRSRYGSPIVVTGPALAGEVVSQLERAGAPAGLIAVEPAARNTAPAVALAALQCAADDILLVMPSDHVIADLGAFDRAIDIAESLAVDGHLVTLGLAPTRAETGFGYIEVGEAIRPGAAKVVRFVEKPDLETAESYLASGRHLWNGGIFVFRADVFLNALRRYAPEIWRLAEVATAAGVTEGPLFHPSADEFGEIPSVSIDYAVMEHAENIAVVPVEMGWSDVGSWDALNALLPGDADGNRLSGEVVAHGLEHCAVRAVGTSVVAIGVRDLTIVAMPDAVLVMPAGRSHLVSLGLDILKARRSHLLE